MKKVTKEGKVVCIVQNVENGAKYLFRHEDEMIIWAQKLYRENEGSDGDGITEYPSTLHTSKMYVYRFCGNWNVYFKSQEGFDIIFKKGHYPMGAPIGRHNFGVKPTDGRKIFNRYVPFIDGAYDPGGAYWGMPANLRCEYSEDLQYINYYRAY